MDLPNTALLSPKIKYILYISPKIKNIGFKLKLKLILMELKSNHGHKKYKFLFQGRIQSNVVGECQNCWGGASSTARSAVEQVRPRQGELRQGSGGAKIGLLES